MRRWEPTPAASRPSFRPAVNGGIGPTPDGKLPRDGPWRRRRFGWFVLALLAVNWLSMLLFTHTSAAPRVTIPFSPVFLQDVQAGRVKSISSTADTISRTFTSPQRYPLTKTTATPTTLFSTQVPTFWNGDQLSALLQSKGVQITADSPPQGPSLAAQLLLGFGPTLLLVGLFVLLARRAAGAGGMGALGAFGRSKARRVDGTAVDVTFDDVAGIDEAKAELSEVVDFLRDPGRYRRLGGRMPHGVLLSGAPGTGKTLLARAVADEAHAAFSISASEFIEAIVGASRVRDSSPKPRRPLPRSSSSTSSTRSGGRATRTHRDGRLRDFGSGRRPRRDEPGGRARPGAPASRPLRASRRCARA